MIRELEMIREGLLRWLSKGLCGVPIIFSRWLIPMIDTNELLVWWGLSMTWWKCQWTQNSVETRMSCDVVKLLWWQSCLRGHYEIHASAKKTVVAVNEMIWVQIMFSGSRYSDSRPNAATCRQVDNQLNDTDSCRSDPCGNTIEQL